MIILTYRNFNKLNLVSVHQLPLTVIVRCPPNSITAVYFSSSPSSYFCYYRSAFHSTYVNKGLRVAILYIDVYIVYVCTQGGGWTSRTPQESRISLSVSLFTDNIVAINAADFTTQAIIYYVHLTSKMCAPETRSISMMRVSFASHTSSNIILHTDLAKSIAHSDIHREWDRECN